MKFRYTTIKPPPSKTFVLISLFLAGTIASCDQPRETRHPDDQHLNELNASLNHICGSAPSRKEFCPTDFNRLAVSPLAADGKEMWILGYLAMDGSQVALFASEEDFSDMQYGRSISISGTREQLISIFSEFGYRKVRMSGLFSANKFDDDKNDRLGTLSWPISVRAARPRELKQGAEDIPHILE